MPPKENCKLSEGKIFITDKETGEFIEIGGVKEVNVTDWDEPTASSRWGDDGFTGSCSININTRKWKDYKLWLKILGVDYDELEFRYKVEFILTFIIGKIKNLKR